MPWIPTSLGQRNNGRQMSPSLRSGNTSSTDPKRWSLLDPKTPFSWWRLGYPQSLVQVKLKLRSWWSLRYCQWATQADRFQETQNRHLCRRSRTNEWQSHWREAFFFSWRRSCRVDKGRYFLWWRRNKADWQNSSRKKVYIGENTINAPADNAYPRIEATTLLIVVMHALEAEPMLFNQPPSKFSMCH
jgi:hypothetical protein